jgi:putative hydrolase of the HAD superfamily
VCLATNQEPYRAVYLWREVGLSEWFDGMVYSAEIGVTKADAGFFAIARRRLRLGGGVPVFLDDQAENVEVARRAGWTAHVYTDAARLVDLLRNSR